MLNNSLIFATTTTAESVDAGGLLPLTTIARRRGRFINLDSGGIILSQAGYYKFNASITTGVGEVGTVIVSATKNGTEIAGITATETYTADTDVKTIQLSGIIRVMYYEGASTIALINQSEIGIEPTNIGVDIEYLD